MITEFPASAKYKPSFEDVYEKYYPGLYAYIVKKVGSREDAEDLTGEVFLYCYDRYDSYDPQKSAVSTWLYLVANSRIKNFYRDKKASVDIETLENLLSQETDDMDKAVFLQQLRTRLAAALETLPERQRKIVILRYFKERSFEDIASELEITPGNVRVLLSRGLNRLKDEMGDYTDN